VNPASLKGNLKTMKTTNKDGADESSVVAHRAVFRSRVSAFRVADQPFSIRFDHFYELLRRGDASQDRRRRVAHTHSDQVPSPLQAGVAGRLYR
jgi:hypothetical protein